MKNSIRRATSDSRDATRRASKCSVRSNDSIRRTHASRSSASVDRPGSACSYGSDSSFSTRHSDSGLADYYSVESLASFDSGADSLDSMLWLSSADGLLPSPTDVAAGAGSNALPEGAPASGGGAAADAGAGGASSAIAEDIPLPPGWLMKTTADGKPYFINKEKRVTTWLDPRTNRPAAATQRPGLAPAKVQDGSNVPLPEGWEMAIAESGVPYFIDHINRKTTWNDPRALMFEAQRESHRLRQLNEANSELRRKIEAIRKQQARLEQEMLRTASPEAIGLAKIKAQADAYAILTLQAQQDTLQRQIEASSFSRGCPVLPDVPEVEPTSPTFLSELASVQRVSSGHRNQRKKRGSARRGKASSRVKVDKASTSPAPLLGGPSAPPPAAGSASGTAAEWPLDVVPSPDSGVFDHLDTSLADVDLSVLGGDVDVPLSPTAVEDFFGSWCF